MFTSLIWYVLILAQNLPGVLLPSHSTDEMVPGVELLLMFCTGVRTLTPLGIDKTITLMFDDTHLPTASTCGLTLTLPTAHEDYSTFKQAMETALCSECTGFAMAWHGTHVFLFVLSFWSSLYHNIVALLLIKPMDETFLLMIVSLFFCLSDFSICSLPLTTNKSFQCISSQLINRRINRRLKKPLRGRNVSRSHKFLVFVWYSQLMEVTKLKVSPICSK